MRGESLILCLCASAIPCLLSVSCTEENPESVYTPVMTVSDTAVTAGPEGGSYGFTYFIVNPADDGAVTCGADADWIRGLDWSADGAVNFSVGENSDTDTRIAHITVNYISSVGDAVGTVSVVQDPGASPNLTVQPSGIAVDIRGGTYSFNYILRAPSDDGQINCTADVGWISDFDCSSDSAVSFLVDGNTEGVLREGIITVTYTYSGGKLSDTVTVVQNHR